MILATLASIHDHIAVHLGFEEHCIGSCDFDQLVICTCSPEGCPCEVTIGWRPDPKSAQQLLKSCQRIWPEASFKTVFEDEGLTQYCN